MRNHFTKISLFILTGILIVSCVAEKRVPNGKELLTKDNILVNDKKVNTDDVNSQLYQKPNSSVLGFPLKLHVYNMANIKHDSLYKAKFVNDPEKYARQSKFLSAKQVNRLGESFWYSGFNNFLEAVGEPPVILDEKSTAKSATRLSSHYFNNGYFNVKTSFKIDSIAPKKAEINYIVTTGEAFIIDSLRTSITTPALDSLYNSRKKYSRIVAGEQYNKGNIDEERSRLTTIFRNNGAFTFQQNYINFDIDTIGKKNKASVNLKINDYIYRTVDSSAAEPFKIYTISEVNIYTDYTSGITKSTLNDSTITNYNNFNLFSNGKLKYRPHAITDGVFITKGSLFSDNNTNLTTRYLNNLKVFNYPTIQYKVDPRDSIGTSLITNIYLKQKKKYGLGVSFDITHSNIQDIGIGGNATVSIRNVFNGAETFQVALQGNIGSSRDLADPGSSFFNVSEIALDFRLNFPRILMFFNTDGIIPKSMIPSTTLVAGFGQQINIGLDKESFTTAMSYNWTIKKNTTARFDLFNIQYVKNINTGNYFNVYESSYDELNNIAQPYQTQNPTAYDANGNLIIESGTNWFLDSTLDTNPNIILPTGEYNEVYGINEQKTRLTDNNLIVSTSFSFSKVTKYDASDENFYGLKGKIETAGNLLSLITLNQPVEQNGYKNIFGVQYSQYIKTEAEYIKHWDFHKDEVLAFRSFLGIAIPYGNANYIPFTKSYYAGGSNDNRGWLAYSLGPGASNTIDNYNEANLKIAFNIEYRFNILGKLNGALFVDAGNIWNVFDNVIYEDSVFKDLSSLENIAVGSGVGLRYDFGFFVFRFDLGFKSYNPANNGNPKWFYKNNLSNSVLNIGINYPF